MSGKLGALSRVEKVVVSPQLTRTRCLTYCAGPFGLGEVTGLAITRSVLGVAVFVATTSLCLATESLAQPQPSAPSDDPAPAEATAATPAPKKKAEEKAQTTERSRGGQGFVEARGSAGDVRFGGLDLGFTSYFSSGLYFGAEGYTGTFSFWLEPSWSFGRAFLKGTWFEPMLLAARVPIEVELAGNDARFRGTGFGTAGLFNNPEGAALVAPQAGLVDGLERRPVIIGDTWLSLIHGKVLTIPGVGISMANSLRLALPTSLGSRNAGLLGTLSLGFIFDKSLGPIHLTYVFRPAKYFYDRAVPTRGAPSTYVLNGQTQQTAPPVSTGIPNPNFGFINGLAASVELPKGFSVSAAYYLFNIMPYPLNGCSVEGVPQADLCANPNAFGGSQWRNDHWFLASVDWSKGPVALSLGLSTYRSINQLDGKISQPFIDVSRNNNTTLYLSFSTSAEQLVSSFTEEK